MRAPFLKIPLLSLVYLNEALFRLSQPLPRIFNLSNTRVSLFPEVEEFLVMLYGDGFLAFVLLFIDY
ncbi:MAG: hypothetical protein ACETWK_01990 [Candidatus Aminicenantaceae bacterium]